MCSINFVHFWLVTPDLPSPGVAEVRWGRYAGHAIVPNPKLIDEYVPLSGSPHLNAAARPPTDHARDKILPRTLHLTAPRRAAICYGFHNRVPDREEARMSARSAGGSP